MDVGLVDKWIMVIAFEGLWITHRCVAGGAMPR